MDILKSLMQHAEQVEVVHLESESTQVRFESNRLKGSQVEQTEGLAVRVVKDGRLGFAATSRMAAKERLVANALESAAYGDEIPLHFPEPQPAPHVSTYDPKIAHLGVEELVSMGQEIVEVFRAVDSEILVSLEVQRGVRRVSIRNQAGTDATALSSPLSFSSEVTRIKGDDVLISGHASGSTVWEEDYLAPARRLAGWLKLALTPAAISSGRMPMIFAPPALLALAIPLMQGLNGKEVYKGASPLGGKLGQSLFDPAFTMVDDPLLDGRIESAPYDDEGVAHRRNVLIGDGALQSFYYDLKTAAQAGAVSTGNGQRGLFSQPSPSLTNLVIGAGETPLADMLKGIRSGLLIYQVLGLGQGNTSSGAFSNPVSLGFRIENGELIGRVKDVSIAGNVYEVLRSIGGLSREREWIYKSLHFPYLLLDDMNVVAKA